MNDAPNRSLLLFLVLFLAVSPYGLSATYYVDGSYTGLSTGSSLAPFKTIGSGLSRASFGDTVAVRPGLYVENIHLKAGVTLRAQPTGAAIIHGGRSLSTAAGARPTVMGANNAVITGFTVSGGTVGIVCRHSSPVIQRNIIRGNIGYGIACTAGSQAQIENNTILGNIGTTPLGGPVGIYVESASPTIRNNIIIDNFIGYRADKSSAHEAYNDVYGNRRNFSGAHPGIGTISLDPQFADSEYQLAFPARWDDFRLGSTSPCRDAGDPGSDFNDADGTRNDIGAFDGDGDWNVSLPAQEFFIESVLGAIDWPDGPRLDGVSRFTSNPKFYFRPGQYGPGIQEVREILAQAVPVLTDGQFAAEFWDDVDLPYPCMVVHVLFDGPPRGVAYRQGVNAHCLDPGVNALESAGKPIIGGELHLPPEWLQGVAGDVIKLGTILHELEHVGGLHHSYRGETIIGQGVGCCLDGYQPYEREAFSFLYTLATGTTIKTLLRQAGLVPTALYPFPRIDQVQKQEPGGWWASTDTASPGQAILLVGSRLTLRWITEDTLDDQVRPPGYAPPVVHFGDISVIADLDDQTTYAGRPARYLKVYVPAGATDGFVWVSSRGLASNPVYLKIAP